MRNIAEGKRKEVNMKTTEIPVYCWHCGKQFNIEINNVYAGHLFCSDEHRIANLKEEIKLEKKRGGLKW